MANLNSRQLSKGKLSVKNYARGNSLWENVILQVHSPLVNTTHKKKQDKKTTLNFLNLSYSWYFFAKIIYRRHLYLVANNASIYISQSNWTQNSHIKIKFLKPTWLKSSSGQNMKTPTCYQTYCNYKSTPVYHKDACTALPY